MTKCGVCQSNKQVLLLSKDGFNIIQCKLCGFGFFDKPPTQTQLETIYKEGYHDYISEADYLADAKRTHRFVKKYLPENARVLDFGCGWGQFLSLVKNDNMQAFGFDISKSAANKTEKLYRIKVKTGNANNNTFSACSFDAITSFDVIEHILDYKKTLNLFNHWIKPKGLLFLTTPSLDSIDARLLKSKWYGFTRIPEHVNYFNKQSLRLALEKTEFKVIKFKPWGFVRSLKYLAKQIGLPNWKYFKHLKVYLPLTDVMVVAQKT